MAAIQRRNDKWQVRVRRKGFPVEVKTFKTRADAEQWARFIETEMDRGSFVSRGEAEANTLKDIIERYIADVMPTRKGASDEIPRLRATCRTKLAKLSMAALTPKAVAAYRDERLSKVKPATVIRELAYLSAIINHARREWNINITNPVALIRKPSSPQGRDRVLSAEEEVRLLIELAPVPNQVFGWRKQYQEGSLAAVKAGETVVPASELAAAIKEIKELQRLLGKRQWKSKS